MDVKRIKWDENLNYALGLYKHLTRLLGIWPLDDQGIFSSLKIIVIVTIQITLVMIFGNSMRTKGNCGSITELVDAISLMTTSSMAVIKIVLPWRHQKSLAFIVGSSVKDWVNVDNKQARDIMKKYAYIGRVVLIVQMFGAYMTIIPLILARIPKLVEVNHDGNQSILLRNIPIGPRCWVSTDISTFAYLAYYSFVCIHLFILATAYLGSDVYTFGLAMHVCGQFELLYRSFDEIGKVNKTVEQRKKIAKFVKRHNHLLRLADKFEKALNVLILCELGANTLIISISEIILIWAFKVGNGEIIVAMIVRIYLMYIQIFMYSYIGQTLSTQIEKLQETIYSTAWYSMPSATIKDMIFIMMRNNHLFHLTAGKIWEMNFENFKNIVKSMFSIFSILRLMLNE